MQKDIYFEQVEAVLENQTVVKYTVGKICNYIPTEVFSLQQDGSLIAKRCDDTNMSTRRVPSQQAINGRLDTTRSAIKVVFYFQNLFNNYMKGIF